MIENHTKISLSRTAGSRLYQIRHALCSNRLKFCEKHNLSSHTLFAWENDKNFLTKKGAEKLVEAFAQEGIFCTVEWLLEEKGTPPTTLEGLTASLEIPEVNGAERKGSNTFQSEINLFILNNPMSKVFRMSDDSMEPVISKNDVVGGLLQHLPSHKTLIGKPCIIVGDEATYYIKLLNPGSRSESYNLSSLNPHTRIKNPVLFDVRPHKLYKIVWLRREN